MTSRKVIIRGIVQGVGFRYWAYSNARRLDLDGHVRNMPDGSVELLLKGDPDNVEHMIDLSWEGPSSARVSQVEPLPDPDPDCIETGFRIRY